MEFFNEKLDEFNRFVDGKKVAIIGMGVSNVPLLDYFYEKHAKVTVFDNRNIEQIDSSIIGKIEQYHFEYFFGENNFFLLFLLRFIIL